jgi:hypothetical protein
LLAFHWPAVCLGARWYEDYQAAVDLIADGECSREAIQLLGAAVVDKPRPNLTARTIAVRTIEYLPYFHLARAHLACSEVDSARYYLNVAREEGVAPADQLHSLEQQVEDLEARTVQDAGREVAEEELTRLVREVNDNIRRAQSLAEQVNSRRGDERFAAVIQEHSARMSRAAEDLSYAQDMLTEGTLQRDRSIIGNASTAALRALQAYSQVQSEITAVQLATPTPTDTPVVVPVLPSATPTSVPTPVMLIPTARPTPVPVPPTPTPTPRDRAEIPPQLRRAARDYLEAEYEVVVQTLSPAALPRPREQAAAHLLRAAAHYALYRLSGGSNEDHLSQARQDLDSCRQIDPEVRPDPRFFAPDFVTLFRER